ncbi:SRPBCC family protein [Nocardioides sp. LHD-245]|uniref:SRPBCC family protein n=1 Tax=Nocardioides sp. LHD-245 TaxID=3051387 RepID=UPI0027E0D870|nr:SRPBCC family protein [Nocardioides sp. LHD-245]
MRIDNRFTVPASPERAWEFLTDLARVAPCLPGATVESVADDVLSGRVALRIGPMSMNYAGEAAFVVKDDVNRIATIRAGGRDGRGGGAVTATIKAALAEVPGGSEVSLSTELALTGRVAQLGQGPIKEVSAKLMGQFADCLATRIDLPEAVDAPGTEAATPAPAEPINLLDASLVPTRALAGGAVALAAVVVGVLLGRRLRTIGSR